MREDYIGYLEDSLKSVRAQIEQADLEFARLKELERQLIDEIEMEKWDS